MKTTFNTDSILLSELAPGRDAIVESVLELGPGGTEGAPLGKRLMELGLLPSTLVRVLRRAPLGDPIEFELRGYRLCLRQSEAARVRVRPSPTRTEPAAP